LSYFYYGGSGDDLCAVIEQLEKKLQARWWNRP